MKTRLICHGEESLLGSVVQRYSFNTFVPVSTKIVIKTARENTIVAWQLPQRVIETMVYCDSVGLKARVFVTVE